jgi:hypothetical protein
LSRKSDECKPLTGGHSLEDLLVPPVDPLDGNAVYGNLDFALVDDLFSLNGAG